MCSPAIPLDSDYSEHASDVSPEWRSIRCTSSAWFPAEEFHDRPSSVLLAFVVSDATNEYARLLEAGLHIIDPLRDHPWGQRRFIGVDPTGNVMIEVLEVSGPPSPEFLTHNP